MYFIFNRNYFYWWDFFLSEFKTIQESLIFYLKRIIHSSTIKTEIFCPIFIDLWNLSISLLVFTSKEEANHFIQRHLLYNRFDLELFTPGDLERECKEELCNYEEAREIFVDEDKTVIWLIMLIDWKFIKWYLKCLSHQRFYALNEIKIVYLLSLFTSLIR